ncbi:hypothetical protein FVR03_11585 [Pontibacter qinzhouensis]|uniref:Uncharacterized protein n=1 Tax=Pontibacter qinzhouensis TaxID=2603253 RepID=A0A5C8K7S4_9BACT|nr:hypothetical protein [Pontibacter qinzhouensis]TXK45828.1 hypothetical protein FVR03_11585 [Pontibacter qinzhouensis]
MKVNPEGPEAFFDVVELVQDELQLRGLEGQQVQGGPLGEEPELAPEDSGLIVVRLVPQVVDSHLLIAQWFRRHIPSDQAELEGL